MGADSTSVANFLLNQYRGPIREVFESGEDFFKLLLSKRKDARGGNIKVPIHTARNWGFASLADGDTLPEAGNQSIQLLDVDPKLSYQRVRISGPAMLRTEGGPSKAFKDAVSYETTQGLTMMRKQLNRQAWGSEEGFIAKVKSRDSGTVLTLYAPGEAVGTNDWGTGQGGVHNAGTRHLYGGEGMKVAIIDSDRSTIHNVNQTVSAVDRSAETVTLSGTIAAAVAVGDFLALHNPNKTTSSTWSSNELEGAASGIDATTVRTTYHGLSRSTYPLLKANVDSSTSLRDFSEGLGLKVLETVHKNCGETPTGGGGWCWYFSNGVYLALQAQMLPFRRSTMGGSVKAGQEVDMLGGVPIKRDNDMPYETVYLIKEDALELYAIDGPEFVSNLDGKVFLRVSDADAAEARLRWYGEAVFGEPQMHAVIRQLNETPVKIRG